jgi:hypothetical protein
MENHSLPSKIIKTPKFAIISVSLFLPIILAASFIISSASAQNITKSEEMSLTLQKYSNLVPPSKINYITPPIAAIRPKE